jgi:hypothetical protein
MHKNDERKRRERMTPEERIAYNEAARIRSQSNPDARRARSRAYRAFVRQDVFEHYGMSCACCGEANMTFLTLHHTNGHGDEHRRSLFNGRSVGGFSFYAKLRKLGYPEGLQTLCWNCHMAIEYYGSCPHSLPECSGS